MEEEIQRIEAEMASLNPEDDKYGVLLDRYIELNNILLSVKKEENNTAISMAKVDVEKASAKKSFWASIASIAVTLGLGIMAGVFKLFTMKRATELEENGTIQTKTFKDLMSKGDYK